MIRLITCALLVSLTAVESASAQVAKRPKAPSNLRVKVIGVNTFLMEWKDNSKTEKGWEIRVSEGRTKRPQRYQLVASPDITSYVVITNELPGKTLSFQLAAYNGDPGAEKFSKPTSVVTTTSPDDSQVRRSDEIQGACGR